jgi:Raf kinase inhibitor-like YbhB/YbcL family protein
MNRSAAGGEGAPSPGFTVTSPAVRGPSETGFDSRLKSAGRVEPKYAARDNGPGCTLSLPLAWSGVPPETRALAIILDDPDAKPVMASFGRHADAYLHWIAVDIDPALGGLAENASAAHPRFAQGKNDAGGIGYYGPQPPADIPRGLRKPLIHVYRLTLFALSAPAGLKNGFNLGDLTAALKGRVIGQAQLLFSFSNGLK